MKFVTKLTEWEWDQTMVLLYRSFLVAGSFLIAGGSWSYAAQAAGQTTTATTTTASTPASDEDDDTPKPPAKPNFVRTYDAKTAGTTATKPVPVVVTDTTETTTTTAAASTATKTDLTKKPIDEKARAYTTRGYGSLRKGAYGSAILDFEEALKIDKDSIPTREYLTVALLGKSLPDQALDQLNIIIQATKPTSYDQTLFGQAYQAQMDNLNAIQSYTEALKLDQTNDTARGGLARAYAYQGRFPEAFKIIQQGLERNKNNPTWKAYFETLLKDISKLKSSPNPYKYMQKGPTAPQIFDPLHDPNVAGKGGSG